MSDGTPRGERVSVRWREERLGRRYALVLRTARLRLSESASGLSLPQPRVKMIDALWPPKPMEFESAVVICFARASLGT